jgi:LPXTG-motif cell wall-anchored protein
MLKYPNFVLALILVFSVLVSSVGYSDSSSPTIDTTLAACAARASSLEVEPKQVSPSGSFEVRGEGFGRLVECDDVGTASEEPEGAVYEPTKNVSIELRQGSKSWKLATVSADEDLAFSEELELPSGVTPGQASVTAKGTQGLVKAPVSVVGEAQQDGPATGGGNVTELPDTGGLPLAPLAGGLALASLGGLLLKRRLS